MIVRSGVRQTQQRVLTRDERADIISRILAGELYKDIALRHRVAHNTVGMYARKAGVPKVWRGGRKKLP